MTAAVSERSELAGESGAGADAPGSITRLAAARDSAQPLLRVKNLSVSFTGRHPVDAVSGLDLSVYPGQTVALVGESGSGKSVTARTIVGLAGEHSRISADEFQLSGRDALAFGERQWQAVRGGVVGFVLQDALTALDPLRTVKREITEVLRTHKVVPRREYERRVLELLADVGVDDPEHRVNQYPHQLSGGLRQRALIASSLAGEPELLVLDEPTTALDVTIQAQIIELLREYQRRGTAMLMISHDLAVVSQLADQVIVMHDGKAVEEGPVARVLSQPVAAYTKSLLAAVPSAASRGQRLSGERINVNEAAELARPAQDPNWVAAEVPVLQADNVTRYFPLPGGRGRRRAVADVSLRLHRGQKLGIVGESGSGKSTLARILLGLIAPDSGEVRVHGESWTVKDRELWRRLRHSVQFISQDPIGSFDMRYTVAEVISEPIQGVLSPKEIAERTAGLLHIVGLDERVLKVSPRLLSGGQAQRVAICRALALRPSVIICDEPVSALDVSIQAQVLDLLHELNRATGTALAFISHDLGVVRHLCDQVIVMNNGFVVERGDADEVFDHPEHPYTRSLISAIPQISAK
ncbi:MAG: ABC transporter ATP-binding protein [Propionibacteriaceae bacterium]|jgi:peptide/nickel transport system ATP-binding protein|nr:ABC transporter ATP-binding protein [Propionibacteriaceae bacterium]